MNFPKLADLIDEFEKQEVSVDKYVEKLRWLFISLRTFTETNIISDNLMYSCDQDLYYEIVRIYCEYYGIPGLVKVELDYQGQEKYTYSFDTRHLEHITMDLLRNACS